MKELIPGLYHVGPPEEKGPLPSVFYFAISGPDSLTLDPFHQPVRVLEGLGARIFSLTLPFHAPPEPPQSALDHWKTSFSEGKDPIAPFLHEVQKALDWGIASHLIDPTRISVAGLSRGAFIAFHLAAIEPRIGKIVAFAPLLHFPPLPSPSPHLIANRSVWISIGNRDTRVGTERAFRFAQELVSHSSDRSPQIEFHMHASIGNMGHGTPPDIFEKGARWLI